MSVILENLRENIAAGNEVARKLGITTNLVSRITGTIFISAGEPHVSENKPFKLNIGLNLKFNRRNEEVGSQFILKGLVTEKFGVVFKINFM